MLLRAKMVGVTGFEPAASWSRTKRTTKLCHTPMVIFSLFSVSGQTCGQATCNGKFIQLFAADLCSVFKGIRHFWNFYARNR